MKILGVDIGYGYTKSFYSNKGIADQDICTFDLFPTAITNYIPQQTFSEKTMVITIDDERYLVGEAVLHEKQGIINTRTDDFVGSNGYCAVLTTALLRTVPDPDILILGLPPGLFNTKKISSLIEKIQAVQISTSDATRFVMPENFKFVPQGSGIYFSHIRNTHGADVAKKIAVIDIGYYTLDTQYYVKGRYIENFARSYPNGVYSIYEQIRREFQLTNQTFISSNEYMDRLIASGKIEIAGRIYELDTSHIIKSYHNQILSCINQYMKDAGEVDVLLVGGGGVKHILSVAPELKYKLTVISHPQYANARGYFEYGKNYLFEKSPKESETV